MAPTVRKRLERVNLQVDFNASANFVELQVGGTPKKKLDLKSTINTKLFKVAFRLTLEKIMRNTNRAISAYVAMAFAIFYFVALARTAAAQPKGDTCERKGDQAMTPNQQSAFACDRLALDIEARKRHFDELGPALRSMRKAVRELPDGYEFEFPSDPKTIAMVAEWAAGERLCCPFFNIQLRMEEEGGPFWLRLTGRKGTKAFIQVDGG